MIVEFISLNVPNPLWLMGSAPKNEDNVGVHLGSGWDIDGASRLEQKRDCGGALTMYGNGHPEIRNLSAGEQIILLCSRCNQAISILSDSSWNEAAWKLALIVVPAGLMFLPKVVGDKSVSRELNNLLWKPDSRSIASFIPTTLAMGASSIPVYPKVFGTNQIAVVAISHLDQPAILAKFTFLVAMLMRRMEIEFQTAAQRAATLTSAASEPFHPKSRR